MPGCVGWMLVQGAEPRLKWLVGPVSAIRGEKRGDGEEARHNDMLLLVAIMVSVLADPRSYSRCWRAGGLYLLSLLW